VPRVIDDDHVEPAIRVLRQDRRVGARRAPRHSSPTGCTGGAACTADFSEIDHLALAHLPLTEVREQFGVPQGAAMHW
jgi:hypothetical protein